MRNLSILVFTLMTVLVTQAHAAKQAKPAKSTKERLVLMPLRVAEEDKSLQGAMETALVQGLQQKYEVFSGEQVTQKAREIFNKESRSTTKKECDETRCMQGIAEAFQAELIATANVTKREGGYFLALSIQNIFDNLVVYSNSIPCKNCDAFQVVDKLKELVGTPAPVEATAPAAEAPQTKVNLNDPDGALWTEAQRGNTVEDYQVYLDSYPKGKYVPLAKARIKKLKEAAQATAEQQEQQAWDNAQQEDSEASYGFYLKSYPNGRFVGLAKVRSNKLKNDIATREEAALWQTVQGSDDSKVVQSFITKYPSSNHLSAAQQKLVAIQKAEAEIQPGTVFKDCAECPEMVVVPAGSFDMGSNNGDADEKPVHRVTLSKHFAMGKTEVTQGQWKAIMGSNPSGFPTCGDKCPVEQVSWDDAHAYVQKMNAKTGKHYRLPSEAEWEYAARAGSITEYPLGGQASHDKANYGTDGCCHGLARGQDQWVNTSPAESFPPNTFGLYDMIGNVYEWVEDSYHANYNGAPTDGTVWQGDGANPVLRGGNWISKPEWTRSANRTGTENDAGARTRNFMIGFRLARTLP